MLQHFVTDWRCLPYPLQFMAKYERSIAHRVESEASAGCACFALLWCQSCSLNGSCCLAVAPHLTLPSCTSPPCLQVSGNYGKVVVAILAAS
jgi:hypothetical protein